MSAKKFFRVKVGFFCLWFWRCLWFLIGGLGSVYFWFVVRFDVGMRDVWSSLGCDAGAVCVLVLTLSKKHQRVVCWWCFGCFEVVVDVKGLPTTIA